MSVNYDARKIVRQSVGDFDYGHLEAAMIAAGECREQARDPLVGHALECLVEAVGYEVRALTVAILIGIDEMTGGGEVARGD